MTESPAESPFSDGTRWRPLAEGDRAAFQATLLAVADFDRLDPAVVEESSGRIFALLGAQSAADALAAVTPDGAIAAAALLFVPPAGDESVALADGFVHPDHRDRGLDGRFLSWLEARSAQILGEAGRPRPWLLRVGCADHLEERLRFYREHGFAPVRYAYKMARSLDDPLPEHPLPAGLDLVSWSPERDRPLLDAFNEAFAGHWGLPHIDEALWRQFFTGVPQFRGDLTFLALDGAEIAGFCLNWASAGAEGPEGWIEAIGTRPAWRGRGLAAALLGQSLHRFAAAGFRRAALDVDAENPTGALRLYEKLGFTAFRRNVSLAKTLAEP